MELFFHDVGLKGATRDFPKTIFNKIPISLVEQTVPNTEEYKLGLLKELKDKFPSGYFNCWGVPSGASSVIKTLNVGDAMLLIKTTGSSGEIPALAIVKVFQKHQMHELSVALWGEAKFPYIFFFETKSISLTWHTFKEHIGYASKFRPRGNVYRVRSDRLEKFNGVEGYLNGLDIQNDKYYQDQQSSRVSKNKVGETTQQEEYTEGMRMLSERFFFSRNSNLIKEAKASYGDTCQVCNFNYQKKYGELGLGYIECHHLNPLSERPESEWDENIKTSIKDVRVLCANCHRMVHRKRPALAIEELKAIIASQNSS
ncbi:restriction endonuclease [Thermoleptolyngbya oregonensis NK1-22]|uniref:Restriction endonuclease n=1 Tax=Thermoleptolyngbya oregonensis NK1-22 TaxID=2547457 RepID=A0AA96YM00_9CYAN|nr:restriction endonuclease [Thermoleptolyngbya oregonensis NK1-22]